MADELEFLTKSADETTWVDLLPDAVSTGYQNQNTNIESRTLGQDDTSITISGTNITLDPSGVIDDDGIPIVIKSAVTLPVGSDGDWYIKVVAGTSSTLRSLTLQSGGGTWDTSKQGYYDTTDRVLNWKITRASGALKLYKRTKPNEGLELNGDITAPQADVTTVNATDVNTTDVNATTGNITTVNSTTVEATTGNITTVNATTGNITTVNSTSIDTDTITTDSIDTGFGAVECYAMNQNVRTTDDITFNGMTLTGNFNPTQSPTGSSWALSTTPIIIPRGIYNITFTTFGSSYAIVECFIDGSWRTFAESEAPADNSIGQAGCFVCSDGVNVRISSASGAPVAYYQRF